MQFDQHARRVSTSVSIFSIASWATGPGYVPCMISHSQSGSSNVGFIRFNCQFKRKKNVWLHSCCTTFSSPLLMNLIESCTLQLLQLLPGKQVMLQFLAEPMASLQLRVSESGLAFSLYLLYLLSISIFFIIFIISITFVFSFLCRIQESKDNLDNLFTSLKKNSGL